MKNPTEEMLQYIYIRAKCGCETINGLLPGITDPALLRETTVQMEAYSSLGCRAQQLMREKDLPSADFSLIDRLAVRGGLIMETMGTKEQPALARILSRCVQDGAGQMQRAVAECGTVGCDPDVLALGQRMLAFETEGTERLALLNMQ